MRKRKTPTAGGMADAKSALQIEELGHLKDGTPIRVMKQADAAHRPDQKRLKELSIDQLRKMVAIAEGSPITDAPAKPVALRSKEAIALGLLTEHPDWTDVDIARSVPCHRSSLYRFPKYMAARELMERERMNRPRGSKSNGKLEAWNDDE